jgi:SRSO17 transposase
MPKMTRFPFFGKRFFRRARKLVGCCHFAHLWRVVTALAASTGRPSLRKLEKLTNRRRSRQSVAFFLTQAQWDAPELLRQTALDTLVRLGWKPGQTVYVVLDDTQQQKRAKRMDAVSQIFLHAEKVYARGHTILGCALVYRGVAIPYAVRLWASQAFCQSTQQPSYPDQPVAFRKLTELAADALRSVELEQAIVLFDAYYLCPAVLEACREKGFPFIGAVKKNRNFFPDGRPRDKRKVQRYGKNVLDREGRWQAVAGKPHRLAERVGDLSRAGRVKLVFSRRRRETSWIALATSRLRWSAKTVVGHYRSRWPIEVLFKMSKQHLGLGDYQLLRYRGVERHLHLVLIAHLLLTHLAAEAVDAQALSADATKPLRLPGISQLKQLLRSKLFDDAVASLENGKRYRDVAKKIKQLFEL